MAEKKMTYEELLLANPEDLSDDDLGRRLKLTELKKAEREVELVESQNSKFQDEKIEKGRRADAKTIIIADENARLERERGACRHKTGGKGLPGFFQGDGRQGYSVTTQQLPTKEVYYMCMRCQKEWRLPSKRLVLDAAKKGPAAVAAALTKYRKEESDYYMVAAWDKPLFESDGGIPGSVTFLIPRMENQKMQDDIEFKALLEDMEGSLAIK